MTLPVDERTGTEDGVLERFLADMVVDDYARHPSDAPSTPGRDRAPSGRWAGPVLTVAVAALIGIVVASSLANTRLSSAERQQTRAALSDRIVTLTAALEARQTSVDARAEQVQSLQDRLLAASQDGPATADRIGRLAGLAAATPMTGAGVVVTVDDAPDAESGSLNRVLDKDLQDIVNELWRDGATGVAVNDQRLTGTTSIRAAGEAILVNYRPLARPYRIAAIGAQSGAAEGSALRGLLTRLTGDYGLVTDARPSDVALPAGDVRTPRFASTTPETGGGTAGSGAPAGGSQP